MSSKFSLWQASVLQTISRPLSRLRGARLRSVRFRYEKAGLTVTDEPIPWNADAVLVEALVRFPAGAVPRKNDFHLRTPDRVPRVAVAVHPDTEEGAAGVVFRLPPLQCQTCAAIHYQGSLLGQVLLPFLSADAFLGALCLRSPTIFALLDKHSVACQTLAEGQFRGLSAGGILVSPTSLLPLCDSPLRVELIDRGTGWSESTWVPLTGSQLLGAEAPLSVVLPAWPQRVGTCSARWILGDRLLAHAEVRVVSLAAFQQSLYLAEGRYLSQRKEGTPLFHHHLPPRDGANSLRPCFLIASREPGMAALCALEMRVQYRDPIRRPLIHKHEMLITDRASLCVPGPTATADIQQTRAFELYSNGQFLGALPVSPTPAAAFTSEGGFHGGADCAWTAFTEEELWDRLEKLMERSEEEKGVPSHASHHDVALATLPIHTVRTSSGGEQDDSRGYLRNGLSDGS